MDEFVMITPPSTPTPPADAVAATSTVAVQTTATAPTSVAFELEIAPYDADAVSAKRKKIVDRALVTKSLAVPRCERSLAMAGARRSSRLDGVSQKASPKRKQAAACERRARASAQIDHVAERIAARARAVQSNREEVMLRRATRRRARAAARRAAVRAARLEAAVRAETKRHEAEARMAGVARRRLAALERRRASSATLDASTPNKATSPQASKSSPQAAVALEARMRAAEIRRAQRIDNIAKAASVAAQRRRMAVRCTRNAQEVAAAYLLEHCNTRLFDAATRRQAAMNARSAAGGVVRTRLERCRLSLLTQLTDARLAGLARIRKEDSTTLRRCEALAARTAFAHLVALRVAAAAGRRELADIVQRRMTLARCVEAAMRRSAIVRTRQLVARNHSLRVASVVLVAEASRTATASIVRERLDERLYEAGHRRAARHAAHSARECARFSAHASRRTRIAAAKEIRALQLRARAAAASERRDRHLARVVSKAHALGTRAVKVATERRVAAEHAIDEQFRIKTEAAAERRADAVASFASKARAQNEKVEAARAEVQATKLARRIALDLAATAARARAVAHREAVVARAKSAAHLAHARVEQKRRREALAIARAREELLARAARAEAARHSLLAQRSSSAAYPVSTSPKRAARGARMATAC